MEEESLYGPESNRKYYEQRYELFSLFDDGIKLDPGTSAFFSRFFVFLLSILSIATHLLVGWYSVCPEAIAAHIADRLLAKLGPNALVMDAMAGVESTICNSFRCLSSFH
jgi:hypothetical protein